MPFLDLPFNTQTVRVGQGSSVALRFVVKQDGAVFDLSGYSIALASKVSFAEASPVWSVAGTLIDASGGVCEVVLTTAHTSAARTFITELQLTKVGSVLTPVQFYLEVESTT